MLENLKIHRELSNSGWVGEIQDGRISRVKYQGCAVTCNRPFHLRTCDTRGLVILRKLANIIDFRFLHACVQNS